MKIGIENSAGALVPYDDMQAIEIAPYIRHTFPCAHGSLSCDTRQCQMKSHLSGCANSVPPFSQVEKPAGGHKPGGWNADDSLGQKQDRDTWRAEKDSVHPWNAPPDSNHQPGQQDRFAPQLGRPRPQPNADATPPPKTTERWRDDGQSRSAQLMYSYRCHPLYLFHHQIDRASRTLVASSLCS